MLAAAASPSEVASVTSASALTVRGLSVGFASAHGVIHAVREVDLDVRRGELTALLGESGSGKSVTARAIIGLTDPRRATVRADRIEIAGRDVQACTSDELRAMRGETVSMVFQDALSALNPVLSIGTQIGQLFREHRGASRKAARASAAELLALVGIPDPGHRVDNFPHQFSGGMRQRLLIAMSIALEPELLIADEPTTALDVTVQAQILALLDRLRRELTMGVLLITHDLGVVCEVADRVSVMYSGRIVESCSADELFARPAHPYTEALLTSVPQVGGDRELPVIPGSPPPPTAVPDGCSFHPRCSWSVERCGTERPELRVVDGDRRSACHRTADVLAGTKR